MKILLLTKSTPWCHLVQEVLRKSEHEVDVVADVGPEYPRQHYSERPWTKPGLGQTFFDTDFWTGDLIISYLYPRVLTEKELARAPRAINFHPAPPWHPGFAPYSWAIYGESLGHTDGYGVCVHHMTSKVDAGPVLRWVEVPILPTDSVERLQARSMRHLFSLFMSLLDIRNDFTPSWSYNGSWAGHARTKAQFEDLRRLDGSMSTKEIEARIRACRYPGQPGAYFPGEPE